MSARHLPFAAVLMALCSAAQAGPSEQTRGHLNDVAAGRVDQVVSQYADDAVFQWVGGPLDGVYRGPAAIGEVWGKFAKANGPMEVEVARLESGANPKGATAIANAAFKGKNMVKVRYVLVYRGEHIVNAVWQVDPSL